MPAPRVLSIFVLLALIAGVALRWRSVDANEHPHGDVHLDAITLHEFTATGTFTTPLERAAPYRPDPDDAFGYPVDQHPPLALLLASALSPLEHDAYAALRRASLAAGLALLAAVYLVALGAARRYAGFAAAAIAGSFALADFSGNGAVYSLHALLGFLALAPLARRGFVPAFGSGALLGLAYLTNYQALVFLPAALLAVALAERGAVFSRVTAMRWLGLAIGFAVVAAPWWIRNALTFGDATYSVNPFYVKWRFGGELALTDDPSGALLLGVEWPAIGGLVRPLVANLIVNARFIASQSALWIAALVPLAAIGFVSALRRRDPATGDARFPAAALFAAAHLAVMLVWPACKFRYFVPLVPFVALLAAVGLEGASDRWSRLARAAAFGAIGLVAVEMMARGRMADGVVVALALVLAALPLRAAVEVRPAAALGAFLVAQAALWFAAPTRTTYFDGILVADQFKQRDAEAADRARQRDLALLPVEITSRGIARVVADVELASHAIAQGVVLQVVQAVDFGDPAANERVLRRARQLGAVAVLVEGEAAAHALAADPAFAPAEPLLDGRWLLVRFAP